MIRKGTLVLAAAVCLVAGNAAAQTERFSGPFAGLFGGGARASTGQSLVLRASVFGVQQSTKVPGDADRAQLDPRFTGADRLAGGSGALNYGFNRQAEQSSISINANGTVQGYSTRPKDPLYSLGAGLGLTTKLTRRVSFRGTGQVQYAPTFNFTPFSSDRIDPLSASLGIDFGAVTLQNLVSTSDIGLSAQLSQRMTLGASLNATRTTFLGVDQQDYTRLGTQADFGYRLFRRLRFRASYRIERATYGDSGNVPQNRSIDFGLDYGDALTLQLSRRTTLSMAVSLGSARSLQGPTRYNLLGNVALSHTLGRSWRTNVAYARTLGFVSAFREPMLQDSATASLGGQLAPRASLTGSVGAFVGSAGFDDSRRFKAYTIAGVLSFALGRNVATFANYTYYDTQLPVGASALPLPQNLSRQSFLVGVSVFAPLLGERRARR